MKRVKQDPVSNNRLVGYARVSTAEQNVDAQLEALRAAGVMEDNLYYETGSAVKRSRPKLNLALMDAREGDTFVVYKLDRLGRSMRDLLTKMEDLEKRGIKFKSLTEGIDTTTPVGRLAFHMIGALAQFERDLIVERTKFGVAAAKRRGVPIGAPRKMTPGKVAKAEKHLKDGKSVAWTAGALGVTQPTIYANVSPKLIRKWKRKKT
jgi:DNA invertase Pin-like site-specific DNA recombinase